MVQLPLALGYGIRVSQARSRAFARRRRVWPRALGHWPGPLPPACFSMLELQGLKPQYVKPAEAGWARKTWPGNPAPEAGPTPFAALRAKARERACCIAEALCRLTGSAETVTLD